MNCKDDIERSSRYLGVFATVPLRISKSTKEARYYRNY